MTDYKLLSEQLRALTGDVPYLVSNLANASALLYDGMDDLNWAGFYLMKDGVLILGPFQGRTACSRIAVGKGVCGTAVLEERTVSVEDVHAFPGHIACDCASNSEIVIPIRSSGGEIVGVLDIDSPKKGRFSQEDQIGLEEFVKTLEECIRGNIE